MTSFSKIDIISMNNENTELCKNSKIVGANVVLFNHEEILYSYNYGYINKENNIKSKNDSLYMIGSNTKILTAMAILKLMEDNRLSLDDDIKKYIPEFEVKSYFKYDKITIENVIMHRSGITGNLCNITNDNPKGIYAVVDALKDTYLRAAPGKMFAYSNPGYTLLEIIIERISGVKYTEYIEKEIAEPLGIKFYFLTDDKSKEDFSSEISLNYDKYGNSVDDFTSHLVCSHAGACVYSSINDFAKFGQVFLNNGGKILKPETIKLMETLKISDTVDRHLVNIGYGLMHNQFDFGQEVGKVLGNGGDTICHHSAFNYIPESDVGVLVFTNSEQASGVSRQLAVNVLVNYLKINGSEPKANMIYRYVQNDPDSYVGKYATSFGILDIKRESKNILTANVLKYPVKLMMCDDGYLQCFPNALYLKVPHINKFIKGMRIKPVHYLDEDILIFEKTCDQYKTRAVIGAKYKETDIPKSFKDACGEYESVEDIFKPLNIQVSLKEENGMLIFEYKVKSLNIVNSLYVIDENTAQIQGFGRGAKELIKLKYENENIYMTFCGILLKKI